jgi:hypothetical protein
VILSLKNCRKYQEHGTDRNNKDLMERRANLTSTALIIIVSIVLVDSYKKGESMKNNKKKVQLP